MANIFSEDDREDLIERGFNDEQLEYLESLEMDAEQLYFNICHIMDDFDDTPEQIIASYMAANEENNEVENEGEGEDEDEDAQEGGRRRRRRNKSKKKRKSRRGSRRGGRKTRKTRKTRRHKR